MATDAILAAPARHARGMAVESQLPSLVHWSGRKTEQAPDGTFGEHGVEGCPPREVDHQSFDGAEIGTRHGANRRSGWDRSTSTPGGR